MKSLREIREALTNSIPLDYDERRVEPRLAVFGNQSPSFSPAGVLLDLSETGMAIEAPSICRYARGELHRFTLCAGAGTVELDGRVCWTRSAWKDGIRVGKRDYWQTAGLKFSGTTSHEAVEILRILQRMIRNHNIPVQVRSSQVVRPCVEDSEVDVGPGVSPGPNG
jgi:hypothetical protein